MSVEVEKAVEVAVAVVEVAAGAVREMEGVAGVVEVEIELALGS